MGCGFLFYGLRSFASGPLQHDLGGFSQELLCRPSDSGSRFYGRGDRYRLSRPAFSISGSGKSDTHVCAGVAHAVHVNNKLSGNITGDGKVIDYKISPDGRQTVFLADVMGDGKQMLYIVRTLGGEVMLLSTDLPEDCRVEHFLITPDSSSVVYRTVTNAADSCGLYSVSVKGGTPIVLDPRTSGVELEDIRITDDSANVLYVQNRLPSSSTLYLVPIRGGPRQMIIDESDVILNYKTTPDSQSVIIYRFSTTGPIRLIHSDLAGNKSLLVEREGITDFAITPDGDYVIFRIETVSKTELFSISTNGGTHTRLNGTMPDGRRVYSYQVTPDSAYVVYKADETVQSMQLLYRAPVNGSTDRIPLITDTFADPLKSVISFEISSDGQWVVFSGDLEVNNRNDLYSVSINGGTWNRLNEGMIEAGDVYDFKISPNSLGVVFMSDYYIDGVNELFAVNMAGTWGVRLNTDLPSGAMIYSFKISNNGQNVVYRADQETKFVINLYVVPITGGTILKVNPDLVSGGNVKASYQITPNDRGVVYLADQEVDTKDELFVTYDFQSPTNITLSNNRVHENLPINSVVGDFFTADPDIGDSFTYSLIPGVGDNASFNICGNILHSSEVFDYASKPVYTIRVKSTDQGGLSIEKNFTIEILESNSIFMPLVVR